MIALSKITTKHQTTVPKAVLEALHASAGDQMVYRIEGGRVTLQARTGKMADLAGKFAHFGKRPTRAFTVEELDQAAAEGWAAHKPGKPGRA